MHLWADQLLPQLLMEQFDTLSIQCRQIEHMHEGVIFFVCTDSTEIFFSKLRSAGLNYNLPSFFTDLLFGGLLIDFFHFFCFQIKYWVTRVITPKNLSEKQTGKMLIRLILQKQSNLGLSCLSRLSWQATTVPNLSIFTVCQSILYIIVQN